MSLQRNGLGFPAWISNTAGSVYTNPSSTKSYVRGVLLHNTGSTVQTVEIYHVVNSSGALGTAATSNRILKVVLNADESFVFEIPFSLVLRSTNDSIQAKSTTASQVTLVLGGDYDA